MLSFFSRLYELLTQGADELSTTSLVVRMALIGCSIFAVVLLISLWGTRYGDTRTLTKSLFMSLVLHGCLGLGWFTVAENSSREQVAGDPELLNTPIHFLDTVDSAPQIGTNKLPIFEKGPATPGPSIARENRITRRQEADVPEVEIEAPTVNRPPTTVPDDEIPQLAPVPDEAVPELQVAVPEPESKSAVPESIQIEQPEAEAQPEAVVRTAPMRSNVAQPVNPDAVPAQPELKRGTSTQISPMIDDGEVTTFPSDFALDSIPRITGAPNEQTIRRQTSPRPSEIEDVIAGAEPSTATPPPVRTSPRRAERMSRPTTPKDASKNEPTSTPAIAASPSKRVSPGPISVPTEDRSLVGTNEPIDESGLPAVDRSRSPSMSRTPARAPETYQARQEGQRKSSVLRNGGSEDSERAVESSLKWLASVQEDDGRWSSDKHGGGSVDKDPLGNERLGGGKKADSGVTGLVVLSFLGAGYTHEKGPYTNEVRRALDWLIGQQAANGYLGGKEASKYDQNYCHAIATFALAEAYAMQKDANDFPQLRYAVRRGIEMISALQNDDGGWRYGKGGESDMSMFGWQLMALKSAVNGGLPVPEKTRRGMVIFLEARGLGESKGLAGYKKDDPPTPAMTAEALFCRQMFTNRSNDAATREAVRYLKKNLPKITVYDEYYWYYGTLAMHQVDDESWQDWNNALRDMLVSMQRRQGPLAGSWDPRGKWAPIGGRLYSTALSTMCLEVYYRYQSTAKSGKPDKPAENSE